ncbi:MAG: serine/threonine-protein kinase [Polyangia bacterium]|jgi:predicted Ser/Thr protein kinase|nr:serine/threonine-protein kinase [Polyangia bacterium]
MTSQSGNRPGYRASLQGQVIDNRFEVLRVLGQGSMGQVYLARQISLDLPRALKVIDATAGLEASMEARFRREALAMSRLQHANIAQVIDFGTFNIRRNESGYYLVMEYVEGASLEQVIDERRSLTLVEMMTVVSKIADAIAYAHGRGIVHRDLKPSNILLQSRDVSLVKVIDFGLVKLAGGEAGTRLTEDQQILGTPLFMSPEQCLSEEVGPPADIYALAGIAYYVLSGRPVFLEKTLTALLMAQAYHEPVALSQRCPHAGVPRILDELLLSCLRKAPSERPTSEEVCEHLKGISTWMASQSASSRMAAKRRAATPAAVGQTEVQAVRQAGGQAGAQAGGVAGGRAGAQAGGLAGGRPGAQAGGLAGRQADGRAGTLLGAPGAAIKAKAEGEGKAEGGHIQESASSQPGLRGEGSQSASDLINRPDILASAIWRLDATPEDGAASPARSRRGEGLYNQLTALLLEFATELQNHLNLTASVGVIAKRIESLHQAISDLEMEAALLDSELGDMEANPAESAGTKRKRIELSLQVAELNRSLNVEYRSLYLYVATYRNEVHDRALLAYYEELARLAREYLEEQNRSQS